MSDEKSNVDKLVDAGVLDSSEMTEEHHRVINHEMTADEVAALIKTKQKLGGIGKLTPKGDGGFF